MEKKEDLIPAFFCVPDITGFTQFISSADISFSRDFTSTILRKLINSNILGMSVGEIEGDAIFFYRTGRLPAIAQVANQCKVFFRAFYDFVNSFESEDPENFRKHLSGGKLGLKIVIHYGNISIVNIKGRIKLIGEDVIIVHKLLKNTIKDREYILLTEDYLNKKRKQLAGKNFNWSELKPASDEYEHIGKVNYFYIPCNEECLTPETPSGDTLTVV